MADEQQWVAGMIAATGHSELAIPAQMMGGLWVTAVAVESSAPLPKR